MAIVRTIDTAYKFEQSFKEYGRGDNFTYKGLRQLFDYLENLSDDTEEDYSLDVIALCCEYRECESIEEFMQEYAPDFDADEFNEADDEDKLEMIRDWLQDRTSVVCCDDDCIMFACF